MCGIVGYWNRDAEPAEQSTLLRMMAPIRHRGPDDSGTWIAGPIGFGHLRLSILDLSERGHQPFLTEDGQGVLTYNGEVYNFRELRGELEREGVRFRSTTDTEVVLQALHEWGPERAVPLFNGMFAFAYWDRRQHALFLGRDRLGIKPLYVSQTAGVNVFASEIKALLAHPAVSGRPDMHALTIHVLLQRLESDWTPFENVRSVLPGTIWKITAAGTETTTYFDVIRDVDVDRILEGSHANPASFATAFMDRFTASVRLHLISDAPLAAMCSGGVDSSLIAAVAKDEEPNLVGYVADVKGAFSEGEKAQRVGAHLGVPIRQVDVTPEDYLRLWPHSVWHNDQPSFHAHDVPFLAVARACQQDGIKVVITGEGSDELFGGYGWQRRAYHLWRRRRILARLIPNSYTLKTLLRRLAELGPIDGRSLERMPFSYRSQFGRTVGPLTLDSAAHLLQTTVLYGDLRILRNEALLAKLEPIKPIEDRVFLSHCLDDLYGYLQSLLQRNDRMGMAASLESRFPFLENQLIDFGMHLPRRAKYEQGRSKWVVKAVAEKCLPTDIVHAPKVGFAVRDATWRPAAGLLKGGMVEELFKWSTRSSSLIRQRIAADPRLLYSIACIELWARLFLRNEAPDQLGEELVRAAANHRLK